MTEGLGQIGERLRVERVRSKLSQRELARRVGISASLISQLESGTSKPSIDTLYALAIELNLSLDHLIGRATGAEGGRVPDVDAAPGPVVRIHERKSIDISPGVRWQNLRRVPDQQLEFIEAQYDEGGSSSETLMRHHGREFVYALTGKLGVQLGFEVFELSPGDTIEFDASEPHRFFNAIKEPTRAVHVVLGRRHYHGTTPLPVADDDW